MKRSEVLIPLSREHHGALSLAQRARLAAATGEPEAVAEVAAKIVERFRTELLPHFEEEERWLLPALAEAGETELVARTLADHADVARAVEALSSPGPEALLAFADGLIRHIRFEERILFPAAEGYPDCLSRWASS